LVTGHTENVELKVWKSNQGIWFGIFELLLCPIHQEDNMFGKTKIEVNAREIIPWWNSNWCLRGTTYKKRLNL